MRTATKNIRCISLATGMVSRQLLAGWGRMDSNLTRSSPQNKERLALVQTGTHPKETETGDPMKRQTVWQKAMLFTRIVT